MPKLKRNELGDTGIEISELGLGTVKFGRTTGLKYPTGFSIPSAGELSTLLEEAKSLGLNYLDTAPAYGKSEQTLGELLEGEQDDWVVSTKVGEYHENGESFYDFSRDRTLTSITTSLERLKLDRLDIVFVHSNGEDRQIIEHSEILPTLIELKQQGVIQAVGFSGKTVSGSKLALELCDIFMIALNDQDQSQAELIELCQNQNKGVVIKKALASGHSTDPNSALKFVNQYPGVSSTIVGTINIEHLRQNVNAVTAS